MSKKTRITAPAKSKPVANSTLPKPFPIVGIGASAGGIEAFTTLVKNLDANLGMAYVLIMHLSPHQKSALAEIVQAKTKMPVHTVKNGMEVRANQIFVIPPNTFISIVDGHLKLAPRSLSNVGNFAVDYFFVGLASVYKNNAVGVILSGTATDGTLGLKAIKAEGGITFAQDETAEFQGMPHSAIESGNVDFVLSPEGIAHELARLVKVPYSIIPPDRIEAQQVKEIAEHREDLRKILDLVKAKFGVDFFLHYKQASVFRRVARRMVLNQVDKLHDYVVYLKANPREVESLYDDLLINVTHFFRDPDFYDTLTRQVFPAITKEARSDAPIRIWVAGCSSGEEAYSVAICLLNYLETTGQSAPIQIFASDLDSKAIEKARLGIYSASALQSVSAKDIKTYFKKINGHFQVVKSVREICVFSHHNLLKDPPFSRMNLISCQNVLIYLESTPQKKVLQTFHYALKPEGFLFLGKSESIGSSIELFEPLDKKIRLYSRRNTAVPQLQFTLDEGKGSSKPLHFLEQQLEAAMEKEMDKLLLSNYVYPSVVVSKSMKIVQFFGDTAPYLSPVSGKASLNVLKMVREDLVGDLMSLFQQARKTEKTASRDNIKIHNKKVVQEITIDVVPRKKSGELFYLVVFRETLIVPPVPEKGNRATSKGDAKTRTIAKLETELVEARNLIRSTSEEYDTTYEELQANNEEILSSNEELQSVNEELETSKEELQSSNEELSTTNEELNKRNMELSESQKDLKQVNEQLEQFAFISSHDLQEPLRKIEIFSDFLTGPEANLNEYARNYATKIHLAASRMSTLIKDLLSYSVLSRDTIKPAVKVDLNEIVDKVLDDFEVTIADKKAVIHHSKLPPIYAEAVQMNQLLHNLIGNALKFDRGNPVIDISSRDATPEDFKAHSELEPEKHYIVLQVKDEGVGFDQQYATKIFTLFQRLHDKKNVAGTGIGLSICKKIVENHGGQIYAEGKENVGATFTVFLPPYPAI